MVIEGDFLRKKKLLYTTLSALIFQIVTIVCGFILPRLILEYYGSKVNGLVNSITQFLQIITFLEFGVGTVVQSALYKPLAENDINIISSIVKAAKHFFSTIAFIISIYVIILIVVYPVFVRNDFGFFYTIVLIISMAISSFSQYFFGITEKLLLNADQKGYIQYNAQTVTVILNTLACGFLIWKGASIQIVKLTTSLVYLLRPIMISLYVKKFYSLKKDVLFQDNIIKQKWNGVAQHLAAVVLDGTDSIVLTIFSSLENVSIYSVYNLVVYGVKTLFTTLCSGIQSYWGDMWAREERIQLSSSFSHLEWFIHSCVVFVYGCTGSLIIPFIMVYTKGINDANYQVPLFAFLITLANAVHSIRLPYHILIKSVGHYKETQNNFIIATLINLIISILFVKRYGLIGVAIGTLCAMLYQTLWMENYNTKIILKRSKLIFFKQIIVDLITLLIGYIFTQGFQIGTLSYFSWVNLALKIASIWGIIIILVNCLFYKKRSLNFFKGIKLKLLKGE